MLISDDNYQNNISDFDEVNNSIEAIGNANITLPKVKKEPADELPNKSKILLFLVGFAYIGLLLISLVLGIIINLLTLDISLKNILLQTFTYLVLFGVLFWICWPSRKHFVKEFKDVSNWKNGIIYGLIAIASEIFVSLLITSFVGLQETNGNQVAVEELITGYPTLMFIVSVIIGPMCEELTYRVGLFGFIRKRNETLGLIISAFVFAFIHIDFVDFSLMAELTAFPIYLTIGVVFGLAYKKGGLPCSYVAHAMINLISFTSIIATLQ